MALEPDYRPGDRVLCLSPHPTMPDLTGTVIESPFPWQVTPDSLWVELDLPAAGQANIPCSGLRHLMPEEEADR